MKKNLLARQARMFYQTEEATTCDICEGEECAEKCSPQALRQQAEKDLQSKEKDVLFKQGDVSMSSTSNLIESAVTIFLAMLCIRFI